MKKLLLLGVMPSIVFGATVQENLDSNSQVNESSSYSSGSMQNYQVNTDSEARHRVGNATCAAPSFDVGVSGRPDDLNDGMIFATFNYPLGGDTCKDAQKANLNRLEYDLQVSKVEQRKRDILFQERMSKVCLELHEVASMDESSILWQECQIFTPIDSKHNHNVSVDQLPNWFKRVASHKKE